MKTLKKTVIHTITPNQIIQHIQNNTFMYNPKTGKHQKIVLFEHQKFLIKKILTGNNVVSAPRQSGISSLFVWIIDAIEHIDPTFNVVMVSQNLKSKQNLKRLIPVTINYYPKYNILTLKEYQDSIPKDYDLVLFDLHDITSKFSTCDSGLSTVNMSFQGVHNSKFWINSILQKTGFNAIYLPHYVCFPNYEIVIRGTIDYNDPKTWIVCDEKQLNCIPSWPY